MPDDKTKRGKPDQDRVSANEPYEVNRLVKKYELPAELVKKIITQEGPMRDDIESYLDRMKRNAR